MGAKQSTDVTIDKETPTRKKGTDYSDMKYLKTKHLLKNKHLKQTKGKIQLTPDTENKVPSSTNEETNEKSISPLEIRQQQLTEFKASRPELTEREFELVSQTWERLEHQLAELGSDLFERMFSSYPEMKGAFGPFRSMSPEDEHYQKEIMAHGTRVLGTVHLVVTQKDNPELVVNHLHELGHKHITFDAKVDFMDIISQMFLFAIEPVLEDDWTPEVEHAWAQLFKFIIHLMKESMML